MSPVTNKIYDNNPSKRLLVVNNIYDDHPSKILLFIINTLCETY